MAYNNNPLWQFLQDINTAQQPRQPQPNSRQPFPPSTFPFAGPAFEAFAPFFNPAPAPDTHAHTRPCPCPQASAPAPEDAAQQQPHGHGHPHRGHRGHHGGPRRGAPQWPLGSNGAAFDVAALVDAFASHPLAAALRTYVEEARGGEEQEEGGDPNVAAATAGVEEKADEKAEEKADEKDAGSAFEEAFSPALDVFSTPTSYVLHVALPGAKKEDVGVNWDEQSGEVSVAGVVYRAGDEAFLAGLRSAERRVGAFQRTVKLPLRGEAERGVEVDGEDVTAKLEDGVLVIRVGKREGGEKRDVRKVDIE